MPIKKTIYKVILSSPSDIENERNIVETVVDEINGIYKNEPVLLQLFRWETDVRPSFHIKGPQGLIDRELDIKNCDMLIGIFYMKLGTPSPDYISGTVHEIDQAIKSINKPEIMLYFKKPTEINLEEFDDEQYQQYKRVKEFKKNIKSAGIICEFGKEEELRTLLIRHFINFLNTKKEEVYDSKEVKYKVKISEEIISKNEKILNVKDEIELIKAIGSNKVIVLEPKDYIISKIQNIETDFIEWEEAYDGYQMIVKNLKNLRILGDKSGKSRIIVEPRYVDVMAFKNISHLYMSNISAGHEPNKGGCMGKVFAFYKSENICIYNSILFGSGTEGLFLDNINNFNFKFSIIENCTEGILTILNSKNILFKESIFRNNELLGTVNIEYFSNVKFDKCIFEKNYSVWERYGLNSLKTSFFDISEDTNVSINNSKIIDNQIEYLANDKKIVEFHNVEFINNTFLDNNKPFREKEEIISNGNNI